MGISTVNSNGATPLPVAPQGSGSVPAPVAKPQAESQAIAKPAVPTAKQVEDAIKAVSKALESKASNLQFSVDKASGETVVKVVDSSTGDVIRQIPNEEVLTIAANIEKMQGLLMRDKA